MCSKCIDGGSGRRSGWESSYVSKKSYSNSTDENEWTT